MTGVAGVAAGAGLANDSEVCASRLSPLLDFLVEDFFFRFLVLPEMV